MRLNKHLFKSICMLTLASLFFLTTSFLYLSITFGWFAAKHESEGSGMDVVSESDKYDIYIAKTTKYDQKRNNKDVYEGITEFKELLSDAGKNFNTTDPASLYTNALLALELDNEVIYDGVYYLVPGSYGTFTLYIKPKVNEDFEVSFDIELSGYKKGYGEDDVPYVYLPNTDNFRSALKMLKGHILFFGGRTTATDENGAAYVSKFTDFMGNHVTYNTTGKTKTLIGSDYYYVLTIYWEWPLLYSDIVGSLQSDDAPNNKYPAAVGEYITAHPDYFFASNQNSTNIDELSDGYNDGDQLIGDNIHFLVVTLK